ncbi:MAG: amylo-alpha-1,6-glucosidase [Sedimentisphaerales bacterium]|nr:amylo-alpha-1,6-glucosidase [Sedimentisphaerales bacterium]
MLTRQKTGAEQVVRVAIGDEIGNLLDCEWLLTNERGSYAAATVLGCNTSSYHGLLIGSLAPPVNRVMALSNCQEIVVCGSQTFHLSTFEFSGDPVLAPCPYLRQFLRDTGAHFIYEFESIELHKAIYLADDSDTVVVEYTFDGLMDPVELIVRPFVGLRDFHHTQNSDEALRWDRLESAVVVRHDTPGGCALRMGCSGMDFDGDPQWWFDFTYRANRRRGQEAGEDLWTPGFFRGVVEEDGRLVFWARLDERYRPESVEVDVETIKNRLADRQRQILSGAAADATDRRLVLAADQFVVKRRYGDVEGTSIVAGYPWFADWGRDTFIALPGLLLATGRFEEARSVLCTFAAAADDGLIPNRFDDRSGPAHFNSVDASLWFIHAAFEYLGATDDKETFNRELLPVIRWIIDSYQNGTRFGIHVDADGLVRAGDSNTQLTWMDAKYDGVAFTPRWGKPVEVNALWHNALCHLHEFCLRMDLVSDAKRYAKMAQQAGDSFGELFWNESLGYLNDTVMPDGQVDASLRPNQIFAISLPYGPPLSGARQKAIVAAVESELLTPYGLRTLSRCDACYQGRYEGPQRRRDAAYHQGTVWPYLMGPFVEAYLKVNDFKPASIRRATEMIEPLLSHVTADGCLGSIAEIFDGDEPQEPKGCWAQAWSVGELLRIYRLLKHARP